MVDNLPIQDMHRRHRALTSAIAAAYIEAASVCLSRHHLSPIVLKIENNQKVSVASVTWSPPDARTLYAWGNRIDTTEAGAYACVIAAVELGRGLLAVRRAETGTGADYYIGPAGSGVEDLEDCVRLEVSGVDAGTPKEVAQRLASKIAQAKRGESSLPAVAGVIGFAAQLVMVADVS